jgi:hypothetical protein
MSTSEEEQRYAEHINKKIERYEEFAAAQDGDKDYKIFRK